MGQSKRGKTKTKGQGFSRWLDTAHGSMTTLTSGGRDHGFLKGS